MNVSTDMAGNSELENAQLGGYADYITDLNLKVVQVFFYEPDQAKKVINKIIISYKNPLVSYIWSHSYVLDVDYVLTSWYSNI